MSINLDNFKHATHYLAFLLVLAKLHAIDKKLSFLENTVFRFKKSR